MTAQRMATILRRLKLTQVEAARRLGTTEASVSRYVNGLQPIPGPVELHLKQWATAER